MLELERVPESGEKLPAAASYVPRPAITAPVVDIA